jgi:hypothetical protein
MDKIFRFAECNLSCYPLLVNDRKKRRIYIEMNRNEIPWTKRPSISIKKHIFVHPMHLMCPKIVEWAILKKSRC